MASDQTLVVGAGFAGAVCAERLANAGERAVVIDRREHIGGNSFDTFDDHGVLVHPYGPHIFHTNSEDVFRYLSQFTDWRFYEHRVLARVGGRDYPFPINRTTLNMVFDEDLQDEEEAQEFLESLREFRDLQEIRNSEDAALAAVGRTLTDMFFRGYTKKQWGMDLSALSPSVVKRIPVRTNTDDRYFTDRFQFMPADGYGALFSRLLWHPLIDIQLGTDFRKVRDRCWKHVVYTGPVDEYFDHALGRLPYRSLRFEHRHDPVAEYIQRVGTVNYPDERVLHTRITEFKHLTGEIKTGTSFCLEHPQAEGEPYYPIPTEESQRMYRQYETMVSKLSNTTFVGRLATYKYYNMDQVVAQALAAMKRLGF